MTSWSFSLASVAMTCPSIAGHLCSLGHAVRLQVFRRGGPGAASARPAGLSSSVLQAGAAQRMFSAQHVHILNYSYAPSTHVHTCVHRPVQADTPVMHGFV